MSFTIDFDSLSNIYQALMLQYNGVEVELRVPRGLPFLGGGVSVCSFFSNGVFSGRSDAAADYSSLENAFSVLSAISPNTIYLERAFAVQDRNLVRDVVNHFRGKAFRDIFDGDGSRAPYLMPGVSIADGKVLKRAPSYRFNCSRHLVSLMRTIVSLGGSLVYSDAPQPQKSSPCMLYRLVGVSAPMPRNSCFLPQGVWLFNRCSDAYVAVTGDAEPCACINSAFAGCHVEPGNLSLIADIGYDGFGNPLEALVSAMKASAPILESHGIVKPRDLMLLRLDGSDFEFSPSRPDVLGYSDYCFDMVKRMDIDVNLFRNAVYDYGTHIEDIINDTFDMYPDFHSGPKAFEAAISKWKNSELRLC